MGTSETNDRGREETRALFARAARGDREAENEVWASVYPEVRRIAESVLRSGAGHTLQPTAIVHEAYHKLRGHYDGFVDRQHFLAVASRAMRQVLYDYTDRKNAEKRGGGRQREPLFESAISVGDLEVDPHEFAEVIDKLEAHDPTLSQIVTFSFFAGFTQKEIAEVLEMGERTVRDKLRYAKAWLRVELTDGDDDG